MDKRLYKSSTNRVLCGVCGGIGEYLNIDPTVIRLLCLMLICGWGSGILFYIVAAVIIPEQPSKF
ncbi:MAG: PspC domain-containing protein [Eubacterium sp.]|jgi:phage shock protein PspC (stress-responsive transcriptional regulator)|nr:PspC domain-containing protein [Eubacterium sp.]